MHHGAEQIAAMLAVLKSGAAYVPAEPSLPQERIDYMMQTAGVKMIITDNYCRNLIPATYAMDNRSKAHGVAYVLYTSGTTGKPKGVVKSKITLWSIMPVLSNTNFIPGQAT